MIELKNVSKTYKPTTGVRIVAINNLSLTLPDKGMVFITGKSGVGKSTLLNLIGSLDTPDSGSIIIDGKNFKDFKELELDSYRNSYLGFVFQNFNLLENCSAYENVAYSIAMQKKKVTKLGVEILLAKVGAEGEIDKKAFELSMGSKQKVAIARALAKDPKIILADEPTGNLDSTSSNEIFEILKEISKDRLVVVVTHDLVSARKYADRLITLMDGDIASDTRPIKKVKNNELNLIKPKIPEHKTWKIAFTFLRKKKLRLALTSILVAFSLMLFAISKSLSNLDTNEIHKDLIVKENNNIVRVYKNYYGKDLDDNSSMLNLTDNHIKEINDKINENNTIVSKYMEDNNYLHYKTPTLNFNIGKYAYYSLYDDINYITKKEVTDNDILIGKNINSTHDVLINKITADYIIKRGIVIIDENNKNRNYYPENYEEILNKKIVFGSTYIVINGIIKNDLTNYESLKRTLTTEAELLNNETYHQFKNIYSKEISLLYVSKDFLSDVPLIENDTLNKEIYSMIYNINNNDEYIYSNIKKIKEPISVISREGTKTIELLHDNEIIVNEEYLNYISKNKYKEYINDNKNNGLDTTELIQNWINENNIIESNINLKLKDLYHRYVDEDYININNIKIVGVTTNNDIYISENILNKYLLNNENAVYIEYKINNEDKLLEVLNKFGSHSGKYIIKTPYTTLISDIKVHTDKIKTLSLYAVIPLLIFSILLFSHLINLSITGSKKQIGILRSLGARKKDIESIYIKEGLIIGISSLILAILGTIITTNYLNKVLMSDYLYKIKIVTFNKEILLYLVIIVIFVIIISSIVPCYKIAKMKPIDAINKK